MALQNEELRRIGCALADTLRFGRVRSIRQVLHRENTFVFECRTPGHNHWLEFSLDDPTPHLLIREERRPAPLAPAPFTMLLRKHVEGLALLDVSCDPARRVIRFTFGLETPISVLHFEIGPRRSNLYLCDASGILLGTAIGQRAQERGLAIRSHYRPPDVSTPSSNALQVAPDWPEQPETLWDYLRHRFDSAVEDGDRQALQKSLRRRIQQARKRATRRVQRVEQDLLRAEDVATLRHEADLLQSARHQIARGAAFAEIPDWNAPDMLPRRIELDPSESIQSAIESRYKRYRRLKDAESKILQRLEDVEAIQAQIEAAWTQFQTMHDVEALRALTQHLERKGLIPREDEQQRIREVARKPYREALSSDGFRILVGRTAKDNDTLSLRIARGRDLWLHARDSAGSHVIVWRDRGEDVPERTLFEAATLAAFYSTAKNDGRVDVGYTDRKHISKPPGSPPGRVSVASMKTIYVEPDETLCRQLFENALLHRTQNDEHPAASDKR